MFQFFRYFSGNLLTVVALLKCQKLRSHATTMFVISLAVSDLLFCTINLPLTASRQIDCAKQEVHYGQGDEKHGCCVGSQLLTLEKCYNGQQVINDESSTYYELKFT